MVDKSSERFNSYSPQTWLKDKTDIEICKGFFLDSVLHNPAKASIVHHWLLQNTSKALRISIAFGVKK